MERETKKYLVNMVRPVMAVLAATAVIGGATRLLQRDSARTQRNNVLQLQGSLREATKKEAEGSLLPAYILAARAEKNAMASIRVASCQRPDTYDFSAPVPVQDLRRIAAAGSNICYRIGQRSPVDAMYGREAVE